MFEREKPDLAAYSHILGNFGPDRPGGTADQEFDSGTSAAAPVACGVGALLTSAFPDVTPQRLRAALVHGALRMGEADWDPDFGRGVVNAGAAYDALEQRVV
jgi:subtilisin family serine protease